MPSSVYYHSENSAISGTVFQYKLSLEVAKMGCLGSEQTEQILSEFYQLCRTNRAVTGGGPEYARAVLEKTYGPEKADELLGKVTKSLQNRNFSFMEKPDEKSLFAALQNKRSQTIALVLSYVEPDKVAGVISQLDEKRQIQVVEGMTKIESVSPVAVKILEAEMRKRMFVFEDIITMDDRSVQRFVRDCDPRDLVLALKTANEEISRKLLSNMSTCMAQNIRDDLEITTNVKLKDVEDA